MLNERHAADEQFVERFRREAQNAAGLNHPNIVSIFDRGQAEGTYYIAMEFLDGRTLKELSSATARRRSRSRSTTRARSCSALAFAHRHGIVHRDIKPHNIVVGRDGRLKVTDFGIARSGASQMTEAGSIVGTAQYLSPEQARGAQVDPRSDLYSLGIVIYEMLTGKVPFTGDAPVEIAMKHLLDGARAAVDAAPGGAARPRRGRHARAREGPGRALRLGRGDGRRPRAASRRGARRLAADRGGDDAGDARRAGRDRRRRWSRARATPPPRAAGLPRRPAPTTRSRRAALAVAVDARPARARDRAAAPATSLYERIQDQLEREQAGRRSSTSASCELTLAKQQARGGGLPRARDKSRAATVAVGLGHPTRTRRGGDRARRARPVTIYVSTGHAEGRPSPTCAG